MCLASVSVATEFVTRANQGIFPFSRGKRRKAFSDSKWGKSSSRLMASNRSVVSARRNIELVRSNEMRTLGFARRVFADWLKSALSRSGAGPGGIIGPFSASFDLPTCALFGNCAIWAYGDGIIGRARRGMRNKSSTRVSIRCPEHLRGRKPKTRRVGCSLAFPLRLDSRGLAS